jgi:hypothetical protein
MPRVVQGDPGYLGPLARRSPRVADRVLMRRQRRVAAVNIPAPGRRRGSVARRGGPGGRRDRQSELFYDIYSTHAEVMRRAYRATHGYVYMVWDGRRWLQQVDGQWVHL